MGSEKWFSPTQILSMLLRHIAANAEKTLNNKILSTVISVPAHFTDIQRRAMVDATKLAGLPLQQLVNDGNAITLAYGIYKKDLPEKEQPPRNVAFVDFGHTSFQVNIFAFSNGKANCLSCVSYPNLGGRDFDERLFNHFADVFNQKYRVNIQENKKSCLKLLAECEKLKRLMSANVTNVPINIECLMGDFDFSCRMDREKFENLCEDLLVRIESALQESLLLSRLDLKDLFSVELVGGSSRVPAVSRIIRTVFGKEVSKTLNFDESVAKGCAIQCALLSPTVLIKQFKVVGVIPYTIQIKCTDTESGDKVMDAFKVGSPSNVSKVIPFTRKFDFQIECSYEDVEKTFHQNPIITVFNIKKVKPTEEGQGSEVKVKFRVDNSGILTIPRVDLIEKKMVEVKDEEKPKIKLPHDDVNPLKTGEETKLDFTNVETQANKGDTTLESEPDISEDAKHTQAQSDSTSQQECCLPLTEKMDTLEETEPVQTPLPKQFKEIISNVELPVEVDARSMTQKDLEEAQNIESELLSQDRYQAEKANSKNALEEYVYEMRDKIGTSLKDFFQEQEKEKIKTNLEKMDEWLMNDETEEEPSIYKDHLKTLKAQCEPGNMRSIQFQERPVALDQLGHSIVRCNKFVTEYRSGSEEYQHLEVEEIVKVENTVKEKRTWLEEQLQVHQNLNKFDSPTVTAAQILAMHKKLSDTFLPIMSKPKPTPKEKPPKDVKDSSGNSETTSVPPEQTTIDTQAEVNSKDTQETTLPEQNMDLD
eukprot:TRINITY_DN43_c0_g1_i9.p1 TRINITY_DN43_c0_g1~~TRINITY_DN43_c0_g1_i9.p1  ORF type:complete len:762 (+),score=122.21 TRINITY_DN43_c0_g1_i9:594-2879(+)